MLSQLKKGQKGWRLFRFLDKIACADPPVMVPHFLSETLGWVSQNFILFVEFITRTTITQNELRAGFYLYYGIFFSAKGTKIYSQVFYYIFYDKNDYRVLDGMINRVKIYRR
jgi:hypothetical protein